MQHKQNPESVVCALARSPFRRKFRLSMEDRELVRNEGVTLLLIQAREFVMEHLTPAAHREEGRQTPFRGHPVFVAQHGTATCCRRCLEKWHHIPHGRILSDLEEEYIVAVIGHWLRGQVRTARPSQFSPQTYLISSAP